MNADEDEEGDWVPPRWRAIKHRQLRDEMLLLAGLIAGMLLCIGVGWFYTTLGKG